MDVEIIFKIAAIGVLTAILGQILKQTGREDISTVATLAGLIIVLVMVLNLIGDLFVTLKTIFNF
ncbi:MAG: stage III sporulation protein AC [Clostridia bacterium]|jgi:stage III sporulation protein AC|nr:stage III sporulation protein AC [Clostridia bacterium]